MISDLLTPPQDLRGRGRKMFAVARPIHVSTKVTLTPNLVGICPMNGRTDGQTDEGDDNIPFAFSKKRGNNYKLVLKQKIGTQKTSFAARLKAFMILS